MEREKNYDIIVAGGGFAGASAAIAAAREGRRVLLIEKYNCLGGAAAFDLVNPFMPYWTHDAQSGERIDLSQGLFSEIRRRMDAAGGLRKNENSVFNEEILKYVLNRMALESGVELLFQAYITGAERKGARIEAVHVSGVSGPKVFTAACFVDATGDANLAYLAGCPFRKGRESDGLCQPMTLCFRLGNIKTKSRADLIGRVNKLYKQFRAEGKIKNPREDVLVFNTVCDDIYHFNTTRVIKRDPTDMFDVTQAEIEAREQIFEMVSFLRENFEEFSESVLLSTGMQIGVRESRMIDGEYTLTQDDLLACARFEDSIAVCNYDIDIHNPDGSGTSHYFFPVGSYYSIPYRCLVPKGVVNLWAAGRCISVTHEAQASVRIMPTCCNLGEAAGTAAALAAADGVDSGSLDIRRLQARLRAKGAKID